MVNATTETVSRLLAKFEREGLARSTRDGIWWRNRPAVAAPLQSTPPLSAPAPEESTTNLVAGATPLPNAGSNGERR
jgi:hypothetical protein